MNKTILVVIDGLRPDAIGMAHTPTLDFLMKQGASSMSVESVSPSITLPAHLSMFTSLSPYSHGVMTNTAMPDMSACAQSLFSQIKSHSGEVSSFYSWENLRNLAMPGSMDYSLYQRVTCEKDLIILAGTAASHIITRSPDFCFIYLEWPDIIGHKSGWMSRDYLEAVGTTDQALELIVEGILPTNEQEWFNLLVVSDHGGKDRHHNMHCPENLTVPLVAWGRDIRKNFKIKDNISLLDVAPSIAHLLHIPPHHAWEGKVISQMMMQSSHQPPMTREAERKRACTP